uniref:Uncharacterized protein n=1 Tax=Sphaerodactylus townsendi TaxID=933632 RepID=A0ACB8G092_9SAUR
MAIPRVIQAPDIGSWRRKHVRTRRRGSNRAPRAKPAAAQTRVFAASLLGSKIRSAQWEVSKDDLRSPGLGAQISERGRLHNHPARILLNSGQCTAVQISICFIADLDQATQMSGRVPQEEEGNSVKSQEKEELNQKIREQKVVVDELSNLKKNRRVSKPLLPFPLRRQKRLPSIGLGVILSGFKE